MALYKLNTLIFIKDLRTLLEKCNVCPTFSWTSPFADPTVWKEEILDARCFSVVFHGSVFPSLAPPWPWFSSARPQNKFDWSSPCHPFVQRVPKDGPLLFLCHRGDILKFHQRVPVWKHDTGCRSSWSETCWEWTRLLVPASCPLACSQVAS